MFNNFKSFIKDESGLGTVEIVIIISILVGLALIFRKQIYSFVNQIFEKIFLSVGDSTLTPVDNDMPDLIIGE